MYKKTVSYVDYNGDAKEKVLYFNLSKNELLSLDSEGIINKINGIINDKKWNDFYPVVEALVDKSYGEKSDDGEYFTKNEDILNRFKSSVVYEALITDLLDLSKNKEEITGESISAFITGILPQEIMNTDAFKDLMDEYNNSSDSIKEN